MHVASSLSVHDTAVLSNDPKFFGGLSGDIKGVDVCSGLDVGEGHLEAKATITTRDDGSLALKGELREDGRGVVVYTDVKSARRWRSARESAEVAWGRHLVLGSPWELGFSRNTASTPTCAFSKKVGTRQNSATSPQLGRMHAALTF